MLDRIIQHETLSPLIRLCCDENGTSVDFDECLIKHDLPDHNKLLILKIDSYYSSRRMHNPPPSIDCLIILRCDDGTYSFYLIELRDVGNTSGIKPKEIIPKFNTVINQFFTEFSDIFLDGTSTIRSVSAWLVTDALGTKNMDEEQYRKKIKGTVVEQYSSIKPFRILNKIVQLEVVSPRLNSPKPIIKEC